MDDHCTFCSIVAGTQPGSLVYEDDHVVAFLDRHPASRHHVLVVPRRHSVGLADADPDDAAAVMRGTWHVARMIRASDPAVTGINLRLSDGADAGQDAWHLHMHVLGRFPGVALDFGAADRADRAELDRRAALLAARFE